jgi:hypothetical protein
LRTFLTTSFIQAPREARKEGGETVQLQTDDLFRGLEEVLPVFGKQSFFELVTFLKENPLPPH